MQLIGDRHRPMDGGARSVELVDVGEGRHRKAPDAGALCLDMLWFITMGTDRSA